MDQVVQEFAAELRQRLGPRVRRILLFGSRARGDSREGSDYDMLVVVDHRSADLRSIILDVESGLMDRHGVLVATVLRSEEEWQRSPGVPAGSEYRQGGAALVRDELKAMLAQSDEKLRAARLLFGGYQSLLLS